MFICRGKLELTPPRSPPLEIPQANKYCGHGGDYNFEKYLDSGSFGHVYRAKNRVGGDVAIKLIRCNNSTEFQKAISEAKILFKLSHGCIVSYYGSYDYTVPTSDHVKGFAIVTNYCSQGDLRCYLKEKFPDFDVRLKWYQQLADAVGYIHSEKIAHRDLKPANILVDHKGDLKVCDVGLAKAALVMQTVCGGTDPDSFDEYLTSAVGTKYYMAPEVWSRHYTDIYKCDVFSLGLVFVKIAEASTITGAPTAEQGEPLGEMLVAEIKNPCDIIRCPFKVARISEIQLYNKMLQFLPKNRLDASKVEQEVKEMQTNWLKLQALTKEFNVLLPTDCCTDYQGK